jgi:hypothetical protein
VQTEKNKTKAFHYRHSSSTETYKNKTSESSNAKQSFPRRISQITKQLQYFPSQQTTDSSFLEKQAPEGSREKIIDENPSHQEIPGLGHSSSLKKGQNARAVLKN